jgi:hypothetical protein
LTIVRARKSRDFSYDFFSHRPILARASENASSVAEWSKEFELLTSASDFRRDARSCADRSPDARSHASGPKLSLERTTPRALALVPRAVVSRDRSIWVCWFGVALVQYGVAVYLQSYR